MPVKYNDIEKDLVAYIISGLADGSVRVGTMKLPAAKTEPSKQVVISATLGSETELMLRYGQVVIDIYANDYATASSLAYQVESLLRRATGTNIKHVTVQTGPVRLGDDSGQERRSLSAEVVVKATDI
jgi:hypothetical protein